MKKTFLAVGLCALFLLFSGCIHGSLDISIPDGITTRMSGDQDCTYYFFSEGEGFADTISGTFTATKDGETTPTTYTATYACLTYTIEDSASVKKTERSYVFLVGGKDSSGDYKEFLSGEIDYVYTYIVTTTKMLADYTVVTYPGDYGYDGYREKEFDLDISLNAGDPESVSGSSSSGTFDSYTVQYNCHFKRTSD